MKTVAAIGRLLGVLLFGFIVYALFFYEGAREERLKRKLGKDYEGPAAD